MKLIKLSFIIAVAVMAIFGSQHHKLCVPRGRRCSCESCHTMHNSLNNGAMEGTKTPPQAQRHGKSGRQRSISLKRRGPELDLSELPRRSEPSSYHVSTDNTTIAGLASKAPVNRGPGGDFGWLRIPQYDWHDRDFKQTRPQHRCR